MYFIIDYYLKIYLDTSIFQIGWIFKMNGCEIELKRY